MDGLACGSWTPERKADGAVERHRHWVTVQACPDGFPEGLTETGWPPDLTVSADPRAQLHTLQTPQLASPSSKVKQNL